MHAGILTGDKRANRAGVRTREIEDVEQEGSEETEGQTRLVVSASVASVSSCSNSTGGNQLMHRLREPVEDVEQEAREEAEGK
jgi:hypothetical protein